MKPSTFPLMADKPEYIPKKGKGKRFRYSHYVCPDCPMNAECTERVKIDMWVMCEIPDELDMLRLNGGCDAR